MRTPPDKIYLQYYAEDFYDDDSNLDLKEVRDDENEPAEVTWCEDPVNESDVEYVRKDILKGLEYIDLRDVFPDLFNDLTDPYFYRFKFCPECGYKQPDGHWKDCGIGKLLGDKQ